MPMLQGSFPKFSTFFSNFLLPTSSDLNFPDLIILSATRQMVEIFFVANKVPFFTTFDSEVLTNRLAKRFQQPRASCLTSHYTQAESRISSGQLQLFRLPGQSLLLHIRIMSVTDLPPPLRSIREGVITLLPWYQPVLYFLHGIGHLTMCTDHWCFHFNDHV